MSAYYSAVRFLAEGLLATLTRWEVKVRERIPKHGGLIVASNHISFWDPPLLGSACRRELHFLAKEELFRTPVLGPMIASVHAIPIRRGVADLSGMSRAIDVLKEGAALLMFPEGSRMRDGELHPARPGVGLMAVNADVPIVPCYISGSNQSGRWWNHGARVRITFGVARPWRDLTEPGADLTPGRALYQQVGDAVMREIAALKTGQQTEAVRGTA